MIPRDLLLQNGTIDALETLFVEGPRTTSELTASMELSESTVRRRMNEIQDAGLVELDAEIRGGQPVRVYRLTSAGKDTTNRLLILLDENDAQDAETGNTDGSTRERESETNSVSGGSQAEESDDIRPGGVNFGGEE